VRPKRALRRIEAVELGARYRQTLGHRDRCGPHLADVERGIEVAVENVEVAVLGEVAAGNLTDQEEVVLADIGGELLIEPQKLRACSWVTCFSVSMRNPSQSVRAIQYL